MRSATALLSVISLLELSESSAVAYPEPIPVIRGKEQVEEFYRRLKDFKLTAAQRKLYKDAIERYKREHPSDSKD